MTLTSLVIISYKKYTLFRHFIIKIWLILNWKSLYLVTTRSSSKRNLKAQKLTTYIFRYVLTITCSYIFNTRAQKSINSSLISTCLLHMIWKILSTQSCIFSSGSYSEKLGHLFIRLAHYRNQIKEPCEAWKSLLKYLT